MENWRKHLKEGDEREEASDQKTWVHVEQPNWRSDLPGATFKLGYIELPKSLTFQRRPDEKLARLFLTEEGIAYVAENVPGFNPKERYSLIRLKAEPVKIPWNEPAAEPDEGTFAQNPSSISDIFTGGPEE